LAEPGQLPSWGAHADLSRMPSAESSTAKHEADEIVAGRRGHADRSEAALYHWITSSARPSPTSEIIKQAGSPPAPGR